MHNDDCLVYVLVRFWDPNLERRLLSRVFFESHLYPERERERERKFRIPEKEGMNKLWGESVKMEQEILDINHVRLAQYAKSSYIRHECCLFRMCEVREPYAFIFPLLSFHLGEKRGYFRGALCQFGPCILWRQRNLPLKLYSEET